MVSYVSEALSNAISGETRGAAAPNERSAANIIRGAIILKQTSTSTAD